MYGNVVLHKASLAILTTLEDTLAEQEDEIAVFQIVKAVHPHIVNKADLVIENMKKIIIDQETRESIGELYEQEISVAEAVKKMSASSRVLGRKIRHLGGLMSAMTSKNRSKSTESPTAGKRTPNNTAKSRSLSTTVFRMFGSRRDSKENNTRTRKMALGALKEDSNGTQDRSLPELKLLSQDNPTKKVLDPTDGIFEV